jgi:hypothetical protein
MPGREIANPPAHGCLNPARDGPSRRARAGSVRAEACRARLRARVAAARWADAEAVVRVARSPALIEAPVALAVPAARRGPAWRRPKRWFRGGAPDVSRWGDRRGSARRLARRADSAGPGRSPGVGVVASVLAGRLASGPAAHAFHGTLVSGGRVGRARAVASGGGRGWRRRGRVGPGRTAGVGTGRVGGGRVGPSRTVASGWRQEAGTAGVGSGRTFGSRRGTGRVRRSRRGSGRRGGSGCGRSFAACPRATPRAGGDCHEMAAIDGEVRVRRHRATCAVTARLVDVSRRRRRSASGRPAPGVRGCRFVEGRTGDDPRAAPASAGADRTGRPATGVGCLPGSRRPRPRPVANPLTGGEGETATSGQPPHESSYYAYFRTTSFPAYPAR